MHWLLFLFLISSCSHLNKLLEFRFENCKVFNANHEFGFLRQVISLEDFLVLDTYSRSGLKENYILKTKDFIDKNPSVKPFIVQNKDFVGAVFLNQNLYRFFTNLSLELEIYENENLLITLPMPYPKILQVSAAIDGFDFLFFDHDYISKKFDLTKRAWETLKVDSKPYNSLGLKKISLLDHWLVGLEGDQQVGPLTLKVHDLKSMKFVFELHFPWAHIENIKLLINKEKNKEQYYLQFVERKVNQKTLWLYALDPFIEPVYSKEVESKILWSNFVDNAFVLLQKKEENYQLCVIK